MSKYEAVIGLEVHAELLTQSKIFCESSAHFGGAPNSHVGPVSLGLPGSLPVLNQRVIEMAVKAGLATNCKIPRFSKFDRKHYFYPDLPKGYQITQFDQPIAESGFLDIRVDQETKRIRLNRIHMEEDAGKLVHGGADRMAGSTYSLVDFNRAGVPLLEIVSEPDLRSSAEARAYLEELRSILMAIEVCDGKMQEGSLRCDANVSVRPKDAQTLGTRVEIKNLNSFKFLQKAVDYEIERQIATLESGETLTQETRLWDEERHRTISMRTKEEAHDYRYFPDPDLVMLDIAPEWVKEIQLALPELPAARRERYQNDLKLTAEDAQILVANEAFSLFFESALKTDFQQGAEVAKWLLGDISAYLNQQKIELQQTHLTPEKMLALLNLINNKTISGKIAKTVLIQLLEKETDAYQVVEDLGLTQISNTTALEGIIQNILEHSPKQVEQYLAGKDKIMGYFVGQVMKETKGRANPEETNRLLTNALEALKKSE